MYYGHVIMEDNGDWYMCKGIIGIKYVGTISLKYLIYYNKFSWKSGLSPIDNDIAADALVS